MHEEPQAGGRHVLLRRDEAAGYADGCECGSSAICNVLFTQSTAPPSFTCTHRDSLCVQSTAYGIAISAAGRCGQPARALELRDEMLARGLEVTHNIRLALLHTFAGAWSWSGWLGWVDGMDGMEADAFQAGNETTVNCLFACLPY